MINDTQMDSGEKLQWECKATGRPRPTYRWLRNGLPLTSQVPPPLQRSVVSVCRWRRETSRLFRLFVVFHQGAFLFSQGRLEIATGELTIHKVQQADSGMYQCVAENKYGGVYSNAELKILGSLSLAL